VLDHAGRVHAANNVSSTYDREFNATQVGEGRSRFGIPVLPVPGKKPQPIPHTTEDIKQILVRGIAQQIAANLGNTTRMVEVQVAGGEDHLNRAAEFLDKRLWQRAIDELQGAPDFAKPEDESYRQYDLGLAYEALAYDSGNSSEQRANIYKAAQFYDKALEQHPKEKYFVVSVARTKEAIARYKELDRMNEEDKLRKSGEAKTQLKTLRVHDVVNMFTAGVPEDSIIETIRDSPLVFEPRDVDTQIAIAKAKLPLGILNEMRKKVSLPPLVAKPK
jgi:tetratricopeptide (TPR) repeat protein